ncbi:hypothetical protein [Nannocystis bainbridge]|uniref:Nucleotidyltransferase family protein n=1 Tax=Nannocystis bainbridge TaxID=2995303 RepID=A0ABT5DQP4_9BACT|nr:hypothetical protein [Nannocystis bainbridge]MDC0715972.1 hypothetical protein [Nannocystis bainbridge]
MAESDIQDFLIALSAAGVRHIVVGAHALAAHGHVRATGDIDILIEPALANTRRLASAVRDFADVSLEYFGVTAEELSQPGVGFFMGIEPDRIDVHTFDQAWGEHVLVKIADVEVPVLGLSSLISAKRESIHRREPGSAKELQDRADLAWLLVEQRRREKR